MYEGLPEGFQYVEDTRLIYSIDYATSHNFVGRKIHGYEKKVCILTTEAAEALIAVQDDLDTMNKGYCLKIFDAYRPARAVRDFVAWGEDKRSTEMKKRYYPYISKAELFDLGYINEHSMHSKGSTVDLTIAIKGKGDEHKELDMGTIFDFFGEESHTESHHVSLQAQQNRRLLSELMERQDFENFYMEWWHFTLEDEPFPETDYDFPVA